MFETTFGRITRLREGMLCVRIIVPFLPLGSVHDAQMWCGWVRLDDAALQHDQISDFSLPKISDTAQAESRLEKHHSVMEDNFCI